MGQSKKQYQLFINSLSIKYVQNSYLETFNGQPADWYDTCILKICIQSCT